METIHRLLADAAVVGTAVGLAWSAAVGVRGRAGGPAFEWFQAATVSVLAVTSASGLLLLALGSTPGDGLHFLYAAVAIALLPLARSFLGRSAARRTSALLAVAFAVLGAVLYRLFTTG